MKSLQISADNGWRRLHQVERVVTQGHPEGSRGDVSRSAASAAWSVPPQLPTPVHQERVARCGGGLGRV